MAKPFARARRSASRAPLRRTFRAPIFRLEALEERNAPSATIPLSGINWTHYGPAPILSPQPVDQGGGHPDASGRLTGIAADPVQPDTFYVSAAGGGIAKTTDGGNTWE